MSRHCQVSGQEPPLVLFPSCLPPCSSQPGGSSPAQPGPALTSSPNPNQRAILLSLHSRNKRIPKKLVSTKRLEPSDTPQVGSLVILAPEMLEREQGVRGGAQAPAGGRARPSGLHQAMRPKPPPHHPNPEVHPGPTTIRPTSGHEAYTPPHTPTPRSIPVYRVAGPGPGRASVGPKDRPSPPQQASCFSKLNIAHNGEKIAQFHSIG